MRVRTRKKRGRRRAALARVRARAHAVHMGSHSNAFKGDAGRCNMFHCG